MATPEVLLHEGDRGDARKALEEFRILTTTTEYDQLDDGTCAYRIHAWLLLLHAQPVAYEEYAGLLERGASPAYGKIQNDVHRTLTTDPYFSKRVTQSALTRLLNTAAWSTHDRLAFETPLPPSPTLEAQPDELGAGSTGGDGFALSTAASPVPSRPDEPAKADLYVQGMNVLAAPILYTSRSEPVAFSLLSSLLRDQLASYFMPGLAGVHLGLSLLDEALALVDPELKSYLPPANIYAFGPVMTLCASLPPLSEVLKLWDFLFAAGPHLGILAVAAILVGMREELLNMDKSSARLRNLGPLDAALTTRVLRDVVLPKVAMDEGLMERIVRHTHASAVQQQQKA